MAKRLFDIVAASCGLMLLWPVMLVVAILVRWKLGSPVLFCQERPGLNGKLFRMLKFRTMSDACDAQGELLPDSERLLPLGIILRKTSLDELPQLINVLKGEMSIVGPRPLVKEYLPRYTPEQMRRHLVRPGITGLAQVNGRNYLPWEERFVLDVHYAENHTFWLDIRILWRTIWMVLRQDGVSPDATRVQKVFVGCGRASDGDHVSTPLVAGAFASQKPVSVLQTSGFAEENRASGEKRGEMSPQNPSTRKKRASSELVGAADLPN